MDRPAFEHWEKVLLDTSMILNVLRNEELSNDGVDALCRDLISSLSQRNVTFVISTVTLSEIHDFPSISGEKKFNEFLQVLNSPDVEIASFTHNIAQLTREFASNNLNKKSFKPLISKWALPDTNHKLLREYISKDAMIAATALDRKCQVVLTTDYKTMHPVCQQMKMHCALLCFENAWQKTPNGDIYGYDRHTAEEQIDLKRK
jgi:predicted nucleic acid-binding protein